MSVAESAIIIDRGQSAACRRLCHWRKFELGDDNGNINVAPQEWNVSDRVMNTIVTADTFRDLADWVLPWHSPHRSKEVCGFVRCGGAIDYPDMAVLTELV